jgi:hypothetical protein
MGLTSYKDIGTGSGADAKHRWLFSGRIRFQLPLKTKVKMKSTARIMPTDGSLCESSIIFQTTRSGAMRRGSFRKVWTRQMMIAMRVPE